MNLQQACETAEKMLEDDVGTKYPILTTAQFIAINQILLELQADNKYFLKNEEGVTKI